MDTIEKIRALSDNPRLLEFSAFVLAQADGHRFPDYTKIDLMQIAPLVRYAWAIDFRDGTENRPRLVYSGTHIDEHYAMNITGKCFEEIYVEDDFDEAIRGNYYQVYEQKRISYTRRQAHYFDERVDRYKTVEAILFPCSSNGDDVNYGLGFLEYSSTLKAPDEKVFELI